MNDYPWKKVIVNIFIIIILISGFYYVMTRLYINPENINVVSVDFEKNKIINSRDFDGENKLFLYDIKGKSGIALITGDGDDLGPSFSPDFKEIAFTSDRNDNSYHVYKIEVDGKKLKQITFSDTHIENAVSYGATKITYKGKNYGYPILYFKISKDKHNISLWLHVDGLGERLLAKNKDISHYSWSKKGQHIFIIKKHKEIFINNFDITNPFSKENPNLLNSAKHIKTTEHIIKDIIPGKNENSFIIWHENSLDIYEYSFDKSYSVKLLKTIKLPVGTKFISSGVSKKGDIFIGNSLDKLKLINVM